MNCIGPRCGKPRTVGALFCDEHMAAPAAKRGGWISAERRRRALGGTQEQPMDASNITKRLWVGGKPPFDRELPFDVLVLCAQELQPVRDEIAFKGTVVRVPLPNSALSTNELQRAVHGGRAVATALSQGKRVLVTCQMGLNRSAFVAALSLGMLTQLSATEIIELIRKQRNETALHNKHFVDYITRICTGRR